MGGILVVGRRKRNGFRRRGWSFHHRTISSFRVANTTTTTTTTSYRCNGIASSKCSRRGRGISCSSVNITPSRRLSHRHHPPVRRPPRQTPHRRVRSRPPRSNRRLAHRQDGAGRCPTRPLDGRRRPPPRQNFLTLQQRTRERRRRQRWRKRKRRRLLWRVCHRHRLRGKTWGGGDTSWGGGLTPGARRTPTRCRHPP